MYLSRKCVIALDSAMVNWYIFIASLAAPLISAYRNFADSIVVRCDAETLEQSNVLHRIEVSEVLGLDFWLGARAIPGPVDIMMKRDTLNEFSRLVNSVGNVTCKTMIDDIDTAVANERKRSGDSYFTSYHEWEEVHAYIESLAKEFPTLAAISSLGNTFEGKPMKIITLSTKPNSGKRALFFDGGLHARCRFFISFVVEFF